jgi:YD repeat-containing protein
MKRIILIALAALLLIPAAGAQDAQQQKINKKNLVIKEWNTDPKGTSKVLDHVTTFNAEGKKIEEIEYSSDGQKWRKRFEYGPDGKVSRELVYDGRNRLVTYKTFDFNEFGRKKMQYTYNAKGRLISIKQYEYIAQDAE